MHAGIETTIIVDFESGTEGWTGPSGPVGATFITPTGGNGGSAGSQTQFNDFGITFANDTNGAFLGDYTAYNEVTLSTDIRVDDFRFSGVDASRPWLVEVRNVDLAQVSFPRTSVWFLLDNISAANNSEYMTYSTTISDTAMYDLPASWRGDGDEDRTRSSRSSRMVSDSVTCFRTWTRSLSQCFSRVSSSASPMSTSRWTTSRSRPRCPHRAVPRSSPSAPWVRGRVDDADLYCPSRIADDPTYHCGSAAHRRAFLFDARMIDTHCHLTFRDYDDRRDAVIADARAAGVHTMITIATTCADAPRALDIATTYDNVYCSAGVHPLHSDEPIDWSVIDDCIRHPRCVAWGELGLDNHYDRPPRDTQDRVLEDQLARIESAVDEGITKPIVVHCREAFDDLLPVFRASSLDATRFVFHCFTGTPVDARAVLDFGAHISFTGVVTFRNAREIADAARLVPDDRILVETDAPFLTPEPHRTVRPNEPKHVVHIARFLAEDRGVTYESFERMTDANARAFFHLDDTLH